VVKPAIYRSIPWLLFGAVMMPTVATTAMGILILALGEVTRDIALGVLTLTFAMFTLAGAFTALGLLSRQNRLTRMQAEFISHVSHELRTPLASIRMYAETLRLGRVSSPEEQEACLTVLEKETTRLSTLVEQLLDFRRQAGAAAARDLAPEAPDALVRDVLYPLQARPDLGPRLSLVAKPALPRIAVDVAALREALTNLVNNAFTHGGPGPVVVTVRADGSGVAVDVRDTGPGIPLKDQERIFERFVRGSSTTKSGLPGLGLGLSLVRSFAEAHGGKATVRSAPGQGSTFTIWLPAAPPQAPAPAGGDPP
jgi:two-component system phosphate regulon sensor histidine kinase PhoR